MAEPSTQISVDALRLLRLVRVRRELRLLCVLAVLALPLWGAFTLIAQKALPRSSRTFWSLDRRIGPGFLLILGVLAAAFVLLVVSRFAGPTGRTAARLRPIFRRGPELRLVDEPQPLRPLLGQLRRRSVIRPAGLLVLAAAGILAGVTGANVWPAWRANHGHGGPVVTIGRDATIAGYQVSSRGHRNYFLETPLGKAIAEDYRPHDGQRWTVLANHAGNDMAYLVGGHDYLLAGLLALAGLVVAVGALVWLVRAAGQELRIRRTADGSLADSVAYLAAGHRAQLFDRAHPVALVLAPLGSRTATALLARHRIVVAGVVAVVVAAVGIPLGLWQAGVFRSPPRQRTVTLSFLAPTSWGPAAFVSYARTDAACDLLRDALRAAGVARPRATVTATVLIDAQAPPRDVTADVYVADLDRDGERTTVAAIVALERELARTDHGTVAAVTGLPTGWAGVALGSRSHQDAGVEIAGAQRGRLVWISLHDRPDRSSLRRLGTELARAVAGRGITAFAAQVAR